ncbi:MAG: response regulator [Ramlibacter sp.]|nr:response regulator [Ramlibacter sp.]
MRAAFHLPSGLARRFALAAAGLAAAALLVTSLAAWWLIDREHEESLRELATRERLFHASTVGSNLGALAERMAEMASSTILATGLVDSAGKETYLAPFLNGTRQINGIPVQVVFTDFEGREIAGNAGAQFTPAQVEWLRKHIDAGHAAAAIFAQQGDFELVAMEPLTYTRTKTPEGALLYKIALRDMRLDEGMRLEWGPRPAGELAPATPVAVPAVFQPLEFRISGSLPVAQPTGPYAPQYLAIFLVALGLFSAVVPAGAWLASLLTRDLRELEAFARRFIGTGLSRERVSTTGSAEVASLARSINEMLDRLNEQHQTLTSEREKLVQLTDVLKTADRRKDEFLAMLAHELRNPLAPISTGAELLGRRSGADPQIARTSDVIARQARHMTKIIDDLLDVSRVTRGLVSLDRRTVDFRGVVGAAVDQIQPLIDSRRHALSVRLPPEPMFVQGDHARLVQIVSNLLSNAARYTPEGGRIVLEVAAGEHALTLTVADDGTGIAPELMPEIFDLFTQGSRSPDRAQGGLGLGLALVKNLVELHGGSVAAASEGVGKGAVMTVVLPRAAEPQEPPGVSPASGADSRTRANVLVVDDNVDAAQTLAAVLRMEGHDVRVAFDGVAALELAGAQPARIFVLDIGLPGMDGIELAGRLRELPGTEGAKFIALTGYGQASDRERSQLAGFDAHLIKPVDLVELNRLLERLAA